jgi:hypothetical protein
MSLKTGLRYWLLLVVIATGLSGLLFTTVQQDIRQSADDPQIQLAEDAAAKLANGQSAQNVVPSEQVDIAQSLTPFLIVFDSTGKPLASSARLNGQIPIIPPGVFDYVRQNGEDRITWQPQPGVRNAIVVTQFQGPNPGFVLAGRSLREVEIREDNILHLVLLGWIGLLLVTFLATVIFFRKTPGVPAS